MNPALPGRTYLITDLGYGPNGKLTAEVLRDYGWTAVQKKGGRVEVTIPNSWRVTNESTVPHRDDIIAIEATNGKTVFSIRGSSKWSFCDYDHELLITQHDPGK